MGKGRGKKGRKEAKALAKKAKAKEPKVPGVPRPPNPVKIAKKLALKEKKAAAAEANPPKYEPGAFPTPLGRHKPFTKQHAKWPALFKKHIGVIESHIKSLDRIMMSMRADIDLVPAKERLDYELGERGNWRAICEMMDRAREVLCSAKEAAKGILPENLLKDKKGLGVTGTAFERLGPQLTKKAIELGYDPKGKGKLGRDPNAVVDEDGDSEMSDASDSNFESESDSSSSGSDSEDDGDVVAGGADFVPLTSKKKAFKAPKAPESPDGDLSREDDETKPTTNGVHEANGTEPSTMFFVDTEPTPVDVAAVDAAALSGNAKKRAKKAMLAAAREEKKANRQKAKEARLAAKAAEEAEKSKSKPEVESNPEPEPEAIKPETDFNALAAKLQEDIEAKTKAQAEAEAKAEKKSKKKRRRSSDGVVEVVEKKAKKERKEKKDKKRKADETEVSTAADEAAGGKKKKQKESS